MYTLGPYRDLVENYIRLTSMCKSNPHKTSGINGEEREGTRDSWAMLSCRTIAAGRSCWISRADCCMCAWLRTRRTWMPTAHPR